MKIKIHVNSRLPLTPSRSLAYLIEPALKCLRYRKENYCVPDIEAVKAREDSRGQRQTQAKTRCDEAAMTMTFSNDWQVYFLCL